MKKLILALLIFPLTFTSCKENNTEPAVDPVVPEESFVVDNTVALDANHRVLYELNLYNFTQQGTLSAAQARLQELRTLGVDIVWLMPIQPRSVKGKIGNLGSPYALRDYKAVNSAHGTLADLKAYVNEAHRLGMEVWLDWVPNHTGLDHIWVTEHPEYYKTKNGQIVHPSAGGLVYNDVYQLDYTNAAMREAMIDAMVYWVKEADIDGYRCDYVSSPDIPASFWSEAIPAIKAAAPNKRIWMLGEADFIDKVALYQEDFDYDYAWGFHDNVAQKVGTGTSASTLRTWCEKLINNKNYKTLDRILYLTNHDDGNDGKNYFSDFGSNVPPMTVLEFTLYGMPLLYNGQEIGYKPVQDYFKIDPIKWSTVNQQLKNTIRTLVALRHTQPALGGGVESVRPSVRFLTSDVTTVLAYTKTSGTNTVLVVLNLGTSEASVTLTDVEAGVYKLYLDSKTISGGVVTIPSKEQLSADAPISIGAKGYKVFVKE